MKTDKKIEKCECCGAIKQNPVELLVSSWFSSSVIEEDVVDGVKQDLHELLENYTPNTEVQKAREEAVRGFADFLDFRIPEVVDEYLQSLKDKQ